MLAQKSLNCSLATFCLLLNHSKFQFSFSRRCNYIKHVIIRGISISYSHRLSGDIEILWKRARARVCMRMCINSYTTLKRQLKLLNILVNEFKWSINILTIFEQLSWGHKRIECVLWLFLKKENQSIFF